MTFSNKYIVKATGDLVNFSEQKVVRSLMRSGANKIVAKEIGKTVSDRVKNEKTSTKEIYQWAYSELKKKHEQPVAARYSLKESILSLGPSGYPFEKYIAKILSRQGYKTKVGVILNGKCVTHEVDVVAIKDNKHYLIEAKFHNKHGIKTNVKVPLYIRSRFLDLEAKLKSSGDKHAIHQSWLVTNTRFTRDAIKYGECMGMRMIGWRYPVNGGLEKLIEETGLHPVTCLTSLNKDEKNILLDNNVILCSDVALKTKRLKKMGFSQKRILSIKEEVGGVAKSITLT
jgi:hypothetical protein